MLPIREYSKFKHKTSYEDWANDTSWTTDELEIAVIFELKSIDCLLGSKVTVTVEVESPDPQKQRELWDVHIGPFHDETPVEYKD